MTVPAIELRDVTAEVKQLLHDIVRVPADSEVEIGAEPTMVWVPPKDVAVVPEFPAKVIEELARSVLATVPSTIEAELTEAVDINPLASTAKRLEDAALF